jgi:ribonuclease HII
MGCPLTGLIGAMDEAGRGPLAGPVVACCVIWRDLPEKIAGINDSKLLTDGQRRSVLPWIIKNAYRI